MQRFSMLTKGCLALGILASFTGCGTALVKSSAIKVTNGRELRETDYPSVVLLFDKTEGAICTGTFITPTVVLSAAHCTMGGKADENGAVDLTLAIIKITDPANKKAELLGESVKVVRNPLWDKHGKDVNKWDLSLITFKHGIAQEVSELASAPAKPKDSITIVGFGLNQMENANDGASAGVKRVGTNRVARLSDGFIQFTGSDSTSTADGTDSSAGAGDSGGPLLIDGRVAGVTSGGGFGGFGRTRSLYVDLWSDESQAFLKEHLVL